MVLAQSPQNGALPKHETHPGLQMELEPQESEGERGRGHCEAPSLLLLQDGEERGGAS